MFDVHHSRTGRQQGIFTILIFFVKSMGNLKNAQFEKGISSRSVWSSSLVCPQVLFACFLWFLPIHLCFALERNWMFLPDLESRVLSSRFVFWQWYSGGNAKNSLHLFILRALCFAVVGGVSKSLVMKIDIFIHWIPQQVQQCKSERVFFCK